MVNGADRKEAGPGAAHRHGQPHPPLGTDSPTRTGSQTPGRGSSTTGGSGTGSLTWGGRRGCLTESLCSPTPALSQPSGTRSSIRSPRRILSAPSTPGQSPPSPACPGGLPPAPATGGPGPGRDRTSEILNLGPSGARGASRQ